MTTMNSSSRQYEKFIFQRKSLHNLNRVKLDIQTFNVLMAIDGKRSVADISHDDMYDSTFLDAKIKLLLGLGFIEPATLIGNITDNSFFKEPIKNSLRQAEMFEKKQPTNKLRSSLEHFIFFLKAPLFLYVSGFVIVAFLLTSISMMMNWTKVDPTASILSPTVELDAGHELLITYSDVESNPSKADQVMANSKGKGPVHSTELDFIESAPVLKGPADRPAEDQPKEIQVDFHNIDKDSPASPKQVKTKWPSASLKKKLPDLKQRYSTVEQIELETYLALETEKKKPTNLKLPYLAAKEIKLETHLASETEFLDYMDQSVPASNWKGILPYASKLWHLKVPMVEKYDSFNHYLEYFNNYHKINGLAIHSAICTLHQLKVFNMPAILEFRHPQQEDAKFLAIKKIDYQKAVLNNGKSKDDIIITHHLLDRFWSGISYIPWKKVIRSADVINTKSQPTAVKELKAYLNSVGFHNLDESEKYNPSTTSAVKKIQTRFGITPTGFVDVVTHSAFNRYRDRMRNQAGPQRKI